MALRLENKNALITGGASGIGRATAIRFAEEGANVAVADRNLAAADGVAAEVRKLGRKAVAIQVDTSDEAQVDAMVARAISELGGVDILVAAAGISHARYGEEGGSNPAPLSAKPFADWKKVLSVNLDGVFLCDRAVAREMVKAGKGGRIIIIASGAEELPTLGAGEYAVFETGRSRARWSRPARVAGSSTSHRVRRSYRLRAPANMRSARPACGCLARCS